MKNIISLLPSDLREGKNIDAYLTLLVCSVLLLLDLLGISNGNFISAGILATLMLIAFGYLQSRNASERLEQSVEALSQSRPDSDHFFRTWNNSYLKETLASANEICTVAVANYNLFNLNTEEIRSFLEHGGKLRCIFVRPDGNAVHMAETSGFGAEKNPNHLNTQILLAFESMLPLIHSAPKIDNVEVKTIDHFPIAVISIVNPYEADGKMFVTLYGFGQPYTSRPSFTLTRAKDHRWFNFYLESFENMWNSPACDLIEIENHEWFGRATVSSLQFPKAEKSKLGKSRSVVEPAPIVS